MSEEFKLTPEQEQLKEQRYKEALQIATDCSPADFETAEQVITHFYSLINLKPPEFVREASPKACLRAINEKLGEPNKSKVHSTFFWGQQESHWVIFYKFCEEIKVEFTAEQSALLDKWAQLCRSCGWWYPFDTHVFISDRPQQFHLDNQNRLHNDSGHAIQFRDGWGFHAVHGVRVPGWIIEEPNKISVENINKEENSEIRRIMLDKFGWDKYLIQSDAKELHRDKYGALYRMELPDDEPLVMVKVIDSTPKFFSNEFAREDWENALLPFKGMDGPAHGEKREKVRVEYQAKYPEAFASYFLRVPPHITRAKQAVAWTFGMEENEYEPEFES